MSLTTPYPKRHVQAAVSSNPITITANRPNSLNDRRGREGRRFIHRRRSFAGEFIHRHLPIPRQGQTAFNERHVIDDGLALL